MWLIILKNFESSLNLHYLITKSSLFSFIITICKEKGLIMNTKNKMFQPANNVESLLVAMPKKCSCQVCVTTKSMAKDTLGEKKFKQFCNTIGLLA